MDWEQNQPPWNWSSPGPPSDTPPPVTDRKGEEEASLPIGIEPVDIVLIDVMCGVAADDSRCTACGRGFSQDLQIELHESGLADRKWLASVSCRCRGWGRHRNEAHVWRASDGLHLEPFAFRA